MKVAVVTGAARAGGIGRAIARRLLADGMSVVISDLERPMSSHPDYDSAQPSALEEAVAELSSLGEVAAKGCDVRDAAQVEALIDFVVERFGRIDVLVNNAGIAIGLSPVVELSEEDWQVNIDVMATGVFLCSRAAARRMIEQGDGGRIVTVASQAGKAGAPLLAAYCAAEFAAIGFTQSLAHELGQHGITVNAVCPGTVMTPLLDVPGGIFDVYPRMAGITREQYERKLMRSIPLGRFETPEDIAGSVAFLASEDAAYGRRRGAERQRRPDDALGICTTGARGAGQPASNQPLASAHRTSPPRAASPRTASSWRCTSRARARRVLLLHGFPEQPYSWRNQIDPIADAGFRVIVPSQRGYAGTDAPATPRPTA